MNRQRLIEIAQWIRDNCIVIDTETTGLGENDTIVELAAICPKTREALLETLVQPISPMSKSAEKVHGITMHEAMHDGHHYVRVITTLRSIAGNLFIAAFNRAYDIRMIQQSAFFYASREAIADAIHTTREADGTTCIMELANRYLHEHLEWDAEQSKFRRLSLEKCLEITGIQREGQAHRALSDALAATDLLNYIAEGKQP